MAFYSGIECFFLFELESIPLDEKSQKECRQPSTQAALTSILCCGSYIIYRVRLFKKLVSVKHA